MVGAGQKHTGTDKSRLPHAIHGLVWRVAVQWAMAMLGVAVIGAGCDDKPPGAVYGCDCSFLTDTDDTSTQKVQICEITPERAKSAAMGCAQSGAPATVQSCLCKRLEKQPACRVGDCAVREHR